MYNNMADIQPPFIRKKSTFKEPIFKELRHTDRLSDVKGDDVQVPARQSSFSAIVLKPIKSLFVLLIKGYFAAVFGVCIVVSTLVTTVYKLISDLFFSSTSVKSSPDSLVETEKKETVD